MRTMVVVIVMAWAGIWAACEEGCARMRVRCDGTQLQVCDAEGDWQAAQECVEVQDGTGQPWACCDAGDAGVGCFPEEACE